MLRLLVSLLCRRAVHSGDRNCSVVHSGDRNCSVVHSGDRNCSAVHSGDRKNIRKIFQYKILRKPL